MGAVYEVVDEKTTGARALKVMLPNLLENEGLRARFALEAKVSGGMESDYIARTFDAGVDDATSTPFLVMELLRGEDLGGVIKRRKALPKAEVVLYLHQAARALDKTHAAGIVHRDLKPDNLFLSVRDDGSPCIKILDFGIAKVMVASDPSIKTRPMMGTPLYMSPEQVRNERTIGPAADVYALGHITYTLLVGETYWAEEAEESPSPFLLISEIMQGAKEAASARALRRRNIKLPETFDPWFFRAISLTAQSRFERATEAVSALAEALSVRLPKATLPPYLDVGDSGATNPLGEEGGLPSERTTSDLQSPSMPEVPGRKAIDTPTVLSGHGQEGGHSEVSGIEGPPSAPVSGASPLRLTVEEAAQTMAVNAVMGRASPAREKAPLIGIQDRSSTPSIGRDRLNPPVTTRAQPPAPVVPVTRRDLPGPPSSTRERPSPLSTPAEKVPPTLATRDRVRDPTPSVPVARDKPPTRPTAPLTRTPAPPTRPATPTLTREGTSVRKDQATNRRFSISVEHERKILRLRVWGFWTLDEAKAYAEDFEQKARQLLGKPWYVLADISDFPPQKNEVNEILAQPMKFARAHGMVRAANLVSSALPKMLIARISAETGLPEFSFFSAEAAALAWLLQG